MIWKAAWSFGVLCFTFGWAQGVSLDIGLQKLESGNASLRAGDERIKAAASNQKSLRGNFLPVVKLELSAQHLDRDLLLDLDPIREALLQLEARGLVNDQNLAQALGSPNSLTYAQAYEQLNAAVPHFIDTVKTQNYWLGSLQVYQPLFHGGRILAANRVAEAKQEASEADRSKQAADLRRDFAKLYVQGALLQSSVQLRRAALRTIEKHRDQAQRLTEQGMVDRTAFLRAEMAVADAQTALADDSVRLESVAVTLAQMAGQKDRLLPSDTFSAPPNVEPNLTELQQGMEDRNPLLKSLKAQSEVVRQAVRVHDADFVPEIGAFGKYELNQSALSVLEPNWVVGVKGSITLFHGGNDYYARESVVANQREVQAMRTEAQSALQAQAERQFMAFQQAKLRYANQGRQVELAMENHRMSSLRFAQGQATSLDVVDAWLAMEKCQLERLASAGDAWMALLEVQWASGQSNQFLDIWKGMRQ